MWETIAQSRVAPPRLNDHVTYGDDVTKIAVYQITIRTLPGDALFEATVQYSEKTSLFQVLGTINRINKHEGQSSCIDSHRLKWFCYCNWLVCRRHRLFYIKKSNLRWNFWDIYHGVCPNSLILISNPWSRRKSKVNEHGLSWARLNIYW